MAYYVDTGIQYRGYNTFRMEAPAKVKSWIFGVEGLETISHSFYAYATTTLSSAVRTRTRWISGNGITLSVEDHTWAIPEAGLFNWIKLEGIQVPDGAVYAQLELHNPADNVTYWVGLIKSEAGDKATDFTHNLSGQLTRITASGIYTGTITAQQVILSSTTGENLPDRLTTINSNMVQLTNKTSKNESDITTIKAGQITLQSKVNTAENKITQIEAGKITLSSSTSGRIAGMSLTSDRLEFSSSGAYVRLMGRSGYNPIMIGTSSSSINFKVSPSGHLTAENATIKGTLKAGSVINGSLNSTTGTHSGALSSTTGTHAGSVSGSLSNTTGRHNGSHYGYYQGQGYTLSNSTIGGSLSGTLGSHYGSVYSGSGTIGGVPYLASSGLLRFNGGVVIQPSLRVYGTIYHEGLAPLSDIRLKKDIETANKDDYLDSFYNLKVKKFRYKDNPDRYKTLGIIAQDFIKDNPISLIGEVVKANDGYFAGNYDNLFFMAVLATQELNGRVKKLEEKLNERV